MISYSVDTKIRQYHWWVIALISTLVSIGIVELLKYLALDQSHNALVKYVNAVLAPSFIGVFSFLNWMHNKYLWRWLPSALRVPDFSGDWLGYIVERTGYIENGVLGVLDKDRMMPVRIKIKQNFQQISIRFHSIDHSLADQSNPTFASMAGISQIETPTPKLVYTWSRNNLSGLTEFLLTKEPEEITLSGDYVSDYPRKGRVKLRKVYNFHEHYCGQIKKLQSRQPRDFLAVHIAGDKLKNHIEQMREDAGTVFDEYSNLRHNRDGDSFHITIVNPDEFDAAQHENLVGRSLWFDIHQLGKVTEGDGVAYYVRCTSKEAQELRGSVNLGEANLHVSLGFRPDDIHSTPKNHLYTLPTPKKVKWPAKRNKRK